MKVQKSKRKAKKYEALLNLLTKDEYKALKPKDRNLIIKDVLKRITHGDAA